MKKTNIFNTIFSFSKGKKRPLKSINYCGYELFYSEGTSIVDRYLKTGVYEQKTMEALYHSIEKTNARLFLDIGANVGLISLAVISKFPNIYVRAFEPGPHQYELFEKTIDKNKLNNRVKLSPVALSDSNGVAFFHIHESDHASGDGFLDTGRAGKSKKIKVTTQTLDDWWNKEGKPKVDVIKCDIEGAELMMLRGAEQLIESSKPNIILEIFHTNLLNYPFGPGDIYDWLNQRNYSLHTLEMKQIDRDQLIEMCKHDSEFIAIPKV